MNDWIRIILIWIVCESILSIAFLALSNLFYKRTGFNARPLFKGVLERVFLVVSLLNGYPHALTFFSAIKLATRLKHEEKGSDQDRFNDYYLIGNMISVLVAIGYVRIWLQLFSAAR